MINKLIESATIVMFMQKGRAVPRDVTERASAELNRLLREKFSSQREAAEALGVTQAAVSQLASGEGGAGGLMFLGLALNGADIELIFFGEEGKRERERMRARAARPVRYENLEAAFDQLGAMIGDETKTEMRGFQLRSTSDLSVDQWARWSLEMEATLKRARENPTQAAAQRAQDKRTEEQQQAVHDAEGAEEREAYEAAMAKRGRKRG